MQALASSICYVCYDCSRFLDLMGFRAINEVGRKSCEHCGDNSDNLQVVKVTEYNKPPERTGKGPSPSEPE